MWIIDIIIEIIGYNTARLLLPAISFGKWRVQGICLRDDRESLPIKNSFNWAGIRSMDNGNIEVESTIAGWIGAIFWTVLLAICIYIFI